jgi:hypothetical protein
LFRELPQLALKLLRIWQFGVTLEGKDEEATRSMVIRPGITCSWTRIPPKEQLFGQEIHNNNTVMNEESPVGKELCREWFTGAETGCKIKKREKFSER